MNFKAQWILLLTLNDGTEFLTDQVLNFCHVNLCIPVSVLLGLSSLSLVAKQQE